MGPGIAVMALIDDECVAQAGHIDLVGTEKVEHLNVSIGGALHHGGHVIATGARHQTKIEPADAARGPVQDVEAVPTVDHHAAVLGDAPSRRQYLSPIGPRQCARAHDEHGVLRDLEGLGEGVAARGDCGQGVRSFSQVSVRVS